MRAFPRIGVVVGARPALVLVGLTALVAVLMVLAAAVTASANEHPEAALDCGDVVTEDVTLVKDLGPCPGHGLIVAADGVTVDLNGFSVLGDPQARPDGELEQGTRDRAGVQLRRVRDATVTNGSVRAFDAGVAIMGGGGNTVDGVVLEDNINYRVVTGEDAQPGEDTPLCLYGEGVAVFNSSSNTIRGSVISNSGPLSGIALVSNSDENVVSGNEVVDVNVLNTTPDGETTVCGTGPEQGPMTTGRQVQTIGVRVEGPGAESNRVEGNEVARAGLTGIALHGYVCDAFPNNGHNVVAANLVTETGATTHLEDTSAGDGIAALEQGPAGTVCVAHSNTIVENVSSDNYRDGIRMGGRGSHGNVVNDNVVNDNLGHGIRLAGPTTAGGEVLPGSVENTLHRNEGHGNAVFDGADYNPDCDDNDWRDNDFTTANQPCVLGPAQALGAIDGTVTDATTTEPIEGAQITVTDALGHEAGAATTDGGGDYRVDDLPPGEYTVTAEADGYNSSSEDATVELTQTTTVDFALQPSEPSSEPGLPESRQDCRDGGWRDYGFDNQGQCMRYVATGVDSR